MEAIQEKTYCETNIKINYLQIGHLNEDQLKCLISKHFMNVDNSIASYGFVTFSNAFWWFA